MILYVYECQECGLVAEEFRPMKDRDKASTCPVCNKKTMRRAMRLEMKNNNTLRYKKEIVSTSMGVHPDQVAEHRRRHPNIRMNDQGDILIKNAAEEKKVKKELAQALGL